MANPEHLKILKQGVEVWNRWRKENPETSPDLSGADLTGAYLGGADISGANLAKADLSKAHLNMAKLSLADLSGAVLIDADLIGADLSAADLSKANLSRANLRAADLHEASLYEAVLIEAKLWLANLEKGHLSGADLSGAELGAKLRGAYLTRAILSGTDLSGADLRGANLSEVADLRAADLSATDLSGAIIDEDIKLYKINGVQKGVNGIYCVETKSAALTTLTAPGNSMQGNNPEAVIESLKRSRSLHSYSMSLSGVGLLILILGLDQIKLPFLTDISVSSIRYALLAMPISLGILSLVSFFMEDALNGVRYLKDQKSAMAIGNFPWILSKYISWSGTRSKRSKKLLKFASGSVKKIQSFITRLLMTFHPLVYLFFLIRWRESNNFGGRNLQDYLLTNFVGVNPPDYLLTNFWVQSISIIVFFLLILICIRIFVLSQGFQKPILFDAQTEYERKTDLEKLTIAVENQTAELKKVVDLIKPQKERVTKTKRK